jgi:hypothetical protein
MNMTLPKVEISVLGGPEPKPPEELADPGVQNVHGGTRGEPANCAIADGQEVGGSRVPPLGGPSGGQDVYGDTVFPLKGHCSQQEVCGISHSSLKGLPCGQEVLGATVNLHECPGMYNIYWEF